MPKAPPAGPERPRALYPALDKSL
ncbi:hypothetical protein CO2235_230068 [Cupriavidus oxalaticus]|uniref:Uncharacterized protein n=1 Tax=Cupriavidus oxalaticus TaxID=96344 RepID=A0A375G7J5_9BURK|nr:hypothetical protein CO2235_230068 [Cupriavidus oxalaticus]